jgi:hypothetical protein
LEQGFLASATAMDANGLYMDPQPISGKALDLIERYSVPLHTYFAVVRPVTRGKPCYHPALAYKLEPDGSISINCLDGKSNLFQDPLPQRPATAVPCPWQHCFGCPEMLESLTDPPVPRPYERMRLYTAHEMIADAIDWKGALHQDPWHCRNTLASWTDKHTGENTYDQLRRFARNPRREEPPFDIPANLIHHAVPNVPIFGYIDKLTGSDTVEARTTDRILVSGWAASTRPETPVREVQLRAGSTQLAVFRSFYPRPEVVATFNREDFRITGWRGLCFVPRTLPRGEHPLVATAVDSSGLHADLPPLTLRVV